MKIYRDIIQRSDEWHALRRGKFTASEFDLLMPTKRQAADDWNESQKKIIYRVAAERMTTVDDEETYQSRDMVRGSEYEPEARAAYELMTGKEIQIVGFVETNEWIGCSPDGFIENSGGYEGKIPQSKTHLNYYWNHDVLWEEYEYQVLGNLWICEREWWDICSYDPRFIDLGKQLVRVNVSRNEDKIKALATRINLAIEKAKELMK